MRMVQPLLTAAVAGNFNPMASVAEATRTFGTAMAYEHGMSVQAAAAAGVLGNVRIPAALIGGAGIAQLFAQINAADSTDSPRKKSMLQSTYTKLVAFTICCELTTVFVSTSTSVRLMAGGFNPMATTAVDLLVREFELNYLAVRMCFFSGLISFVSAFAVRAYAQIEDRDLERAVAFAFAGTVITMCGFWNSTFANYGGIFGVASRLLYLVGCSALKNPFVSAMAAACFGGAIYFGVVKEFVRACSSGEGCATAFAPKAAAKAE